MESGLAGLPGTRRRLLVECEDVSAGGPPRPIVNQRGGMEIHPREEDLPGSVGRHRQGRGGGGCPRCDGRADATVLFASRE